MVDKAPNLSRGSHSAFTDSFDAFTDSFNSPRPAAGTVTERQNLPSRGGQRFTEPPGAVGVPEAGEGVEGRQDFLDVRIFSGEHDGRPGRAASTGVYASAP
jgi:hypothetical protein